VDDLDGPIPTPSVTTPDIDPDEVAARLARLAEELTARGPLRTERWRRALLGVARHVFVPGYWVDENLGAFPARWRRVEATDPDRHGEWRDAVYRDTTLVTDLRPAPGGASEPVVTSSSTLPGLVVDMIEDLDPQPGEDVLEIGIGTGYSAALLCHGLGDVHVTSVDIDPRLVRAARAGLTAHGYHPHLAAADGAQGLPGRAPFDRVVATCSVDAVPAAWIAQTRPGGTILANLRGPLMRGALVRLTAHGDGTAAGPFLPGYGAFMALRHDATAPFDHRVVVEKDPGPSAARTTDLDPAELFSDAAWAFVAQLHLPDAVAWPVADETGSVRAIEIATSDGSWARITATGPGRRVVQTGPRRVWDLLERAHQDWVGDGRPRWDRYGLTVSADGRHRIWLDDPGEPVPAG
jgi:methyltransferase of ATP-grasp peptide maturase system